MEQVNYDKQLKRWARNHYQDSLEKDKDLIMRHLRTFAGDEIEHDEPCAVCGPEYVANYCFKCGREI